MANNISEIREEIRSKDETNPLLLLGDDQLKERLYNNSDSLQEKYTDYASFQKTFGEADKIIERQKYLKESPFNYSITKKLADVFEGDNLKLLRARQKLKLQTPLSAGVSDTLSGVGSILEDYTPVGRLPDRVKAGFADAFSLSKGVLFGQDNLVTEDEDGYKKSVVAPENTITNTLVRGGSSLAVPYGGTLRAFNYADKFRQASKIKKAQKLFPDSTVKSVKSVPSKYPITKLAAKTLVASEVSSQVAINPENALVGNFIGKFIGDDKETLQTLIEYVSADESKTDGENRVALLFDGLFLSGTITAGVKIGGLVFNSSKKLLRYFKDIKAKGTVEEKKELIETITEASKESPSATKTLYEFNEEGIPVPVRPVAAKDSWKQKKEYELKTPDVRAPEPEDVLNLYGFSENSFLRNSDFILGAFGRSRGTYTPKMFEVLNLNANAAVAWSSKGEQLMRQVDNTLESLAKNPSVNLNKKQLDKLFDNYITGKGNLDDLPVALQEVAKDSRTQIDIVSEMISQSKYVSPELRKVIGNELGVYLRTTYKKFDDPNWKPSSKVIRDGVQMVYKKMSKYKVNEEKMMTAKGRESIRKEAEASIDIILRNAKYSENVFDFLNTVKGTGQAKVIFKEKQKLSKEIQNLLGVETETSKRIFSTLNTLGEFIHSQSTFAKFKELGYNKYFFDKPTGQFSFQIKGKQFGALDKMYTTDTMRLNFYNPVKLAIEKDGSGVVDFGVNAVKMMYATKGFSQGSKTVFNNITHERNFQSSGLIMLGNGMNPISRKSYKHLQVAWSSVKLTDNVAINNLYNKYLSLGITNQNAKIGDIRSLLESAEKTGAGGIINKYAETFKVKKVYDKVTKAYVAEDDIWKIAVFENELATLKKALPTEKLSVLEREAARITRNTMPTYDMIPFGFKALRYSPWGNYMSFHAERFRNTFHTYKQAAEEINSGNSILVKRGYKRLGAKVAVGQRGAAITAFTSLQLAGVGKEEDKHIKSLMQQDYHGDDWVYDTQASTGKLTFSDVKYTDPDGPVNDVISTVFEYTNTDNMSQQDFEERLFTAVTDSFGKILAPFVDETILFGAVADLTFRNGQTAQMDGSLETIPNWDTTSNKTMDSRMNNFMVGTKHVLNKAFKPVILDNVGNIISAFRAKEDKYGVKKNVELEVFKNLVGFNFKAVDRDNLYKSLAQNVGRFNGEKGIATNEIMYKDIENSRVELSEEDVLENFKSANRQYYIQYSQTAHKVNSILELAKLDNSRVQQGGESRFNLDYDTTRKTLEEKGMPTAIINQMLRSDSNPQFIPLSFSEEKFSRLYKMNPNLDIGYLRAELNNARINFLKLPVLDMRSDYSEKDIKAFKETTTKSEPRLKKYKGLEVNVPYTKDESETRINKFTGVPYVEQMDRLGFVDGGNVGNPIVGTEILNNEIIKTFQDGTTSSTIIKETEEQGLKQVAPIVEFLTGGTLFKTGKVIGEVGGEIIQKKIMPKTIYHGSGVNNLKTIKSTNSRMDNPSSGLQSVIFASSSKGTAAIYAKNQVPEVGVKNILTKGVVDKGTVYPIDTSEISKNVIKSFGKNKVINSASPPKKLLKNLDKEIKFLSSSSAKSLLGNDFKRQAKSLKMFKAQLTKDKDIYVTKVNPTVRNFLEKNNISVIKTNPVKGKSTYILVRDEVSPISKGK